MIEDSVRSQTSEENTISDRTANEADLKEDDESQNMASEALHAFDATSPQSESGQAMPLLKGILKMKQPQSEVFKIMNKTMVERCHITANDKFDFENRLRDIVGELIKPVYQRITLTLSEHQKLKMKIEKQERTLADSLEWIKSRGDPSEISEEMAKKFKELEKQSLSKHNNNKTDDYYHFKKPHHSHHDFLAETGI